MANSLNLRYRSAAGPARVFVNGFLIINDAVGESSSTRLEPYVVGGRNILHLHGATGAIVSASVQVVATQDNAGTAESVLCTLRLPDSAAVGGVAQSGFDLPAGSPVWGWTRLQPAPPVADANAHAYLAALAHLLLAGPDDELLKQLEYKHSEVGMALTIGKAAMDRGLTEGLASRRRDSTFKVDIVAATELVLVWSPDHRLARPLRKNGQDAILLRSDGAWNGFEVTLGHADGHWMVIR